MWAYCGNNPVNRADSQGDFFNTIIGGIVGGIIGGIAASIQGESFWEGAASGAVSGAISGAAVDIGLLAAGAAVATCGARSSVDWCWHCCCGRRFRRRSRCWSFSSIW